MKNSLSLFLLILVFNTPLQACLPDGIIFSTQQSIDQFATQYPGCTGIEGQVIVKGDDITNLDGLSSLTSVGSHLKIWENKNLISIAGLSNLVSIGGDFNFINNSDIEDLNGLNALTTVNDHITISYNYSLLNVEALAKLSTVGGFLFFHENDNLSDLKGLENITSVGGELVVSDNDVLSSLTGLENLTFIGGLLRISGNEKLETLQALANLTEVGGELRIENTVLLSNLQGLEKLTSTDGDIWFYNNAALIDIRALSNVRQMNGVIAIRENPLLPSLNGLENINPSGIQGLSFFNSPELTQCEVASICTYLDNGGIASTISGNKTGCNSIAEIQTACIATSTASPDQSLQDLRILPNPISDEIWLEFSRPAIAQVKVMNIWGTVVYEGQVGTQQRVDLSNLPSGSYVVRVNLPGEKPQVRRMVKGIH